MPSKLWNISLHGKKVHCDFRSVSFLCSFLFTKNIIDCHHSTSTAHMVPSTESNGIIYSYDCNITVSMR